MTRGLRVWGARRKSKGSLRQVIMEEQKVRACQGASFGRVFECAGAEQTAGQEIDTP